MEEKNPFEKKDPNEEIEDILDESPLEEPKPQLKTKALGKRPRFSKKKIILTIAIIVVIMGAGLILIQKPCEPYGTETTEVISNEDFVNSIKQQIIDKGYAEIGDETFTLKLSPYTG